MIDILESFVPLVGTPDEDDAIEYIYRAYLPVSFSRDMLERTPHRLALMPDDNAFLAVSFHIDLRPDLNNFFLVFKIRDHDLRTVRNFSAIIQKDLLRKKINEINELRGR